MLLARWHSPLNTALWKGRQTNPVVTSLGYIQRPCISSFLNLKVSILIMARSCWLLLQSAPTVLSITRIIATTTWPMDSFLYQWRLPAAPAQKMSVLWTIEFLNSRIHVDSRRLIRNQKQSNRDALIYSASSSRNIDPRTMSVMEGILQNGATFTEWTK